jgi:hypothetical protein
MVDRLDWSILSSSQQNVEARHVARTSPLEGLRPSAPLITVKHYSCWSTTVS